VASRVPADFVVVLASVTAATRAHAVPEFAQETGEPCKEQTGRLR
jgi:hypothetical protein